MLSKIFDCTPKLHGVVPEPAEGPIAVETEDASNPPGGTVVIDVRPRSEADGTDSFRLSYRS